VSLSVYVMPLWRFKVGDFRSPIETSLGIRPKIVTPDGILDDAPRTSWWAKWQARRKVAAVRRAAEKANGVSVRWQDEGDVVYSQQAIVGFEALRAYARWLDCRDQFPTFDDPPEQNYYKHPAVSAAVAKRSCPQLVAHGCYSGYFLPCEFEQLVQVEPYTIAGTWNFTRSVGSTPQLLRELNVVQETLQVPDEYECMNDGTPHWQVKFGYRQLLTMARLSLQHELPIIFWG
jgi:hypothetical protein